MADFPICPSGCKVNGSCTPQQEVDETKLPKELRDLVHEKTMKKVKELHGLPGNCEGIGNCMKTYSRFLDNYKHWHKFYESNQKCDHLKHEAEHGKAGIKGFLNDLF